MPGGEGAAEVCGVSLYVGGGERCGWRRGGVGAGFGPVRRFRPAGRSRAACPAKASWQGFRATGDAAVGALHECAGRRAGRLSIRRRGGSLGRQLVDEPAADEGPGRVDLLGQPGGQGAHEVVDSHAAREPVTGQRRECCAVGGGEGQARVVEAEAGEGIVGGGGGGPFRRGLLRPRLQLGLCPGLR